VPAWLVWVLVAVGLTVGEILTPGLFFLGPIALAAVGAAVVAAIGLGWLGQLIVFVAGAAASLALLRPIARAHLRMPRAIRTGTAALEGSRALVLERVDASGGRVRIGGEVWSARAFDDAQVLEPGAWVEVMRIEGATALVYE
jgi:membrane protein implicated in regulation of membrane protease activity